jgi:hypothetical protein
MVHDRTAGRKDGREIHRAHHLDMLKTRDALKSLQPAQTNARSPNCAQAALIMASVSAGESTGMLPNPKKIGGVPAAIHDATSSSAAVGDSIVGVPTNGRRPFHFAHSARSQGTHTSP